MEQLRIWLLSAVVIQLVFTSAVLSNDNENSINIEYQSADGANVLFWDCNYRTPTPTLYINITSVTGGSGNYTITPVSNTFVSQSNISEGEGFTFYFTKAAQSADNVRFTVSDTQGNSCPIDFSVETQLYFLDIGNCEEPDYICKEDIRHFEGMVPVTDHYAIDSITSFGTVQSTTKINYYAGTVIELQSGFEVQTNADFLATIQGCP